jgi:GTP-binding protein YchF
MLADLETLKKREITISKRNNPDFANEKKFLDKTIDWLENGKLLNLLNLQDEEVVFWETMHLITRKPILYICNVNESEVVSGNAFTEAVDEFAKSRNSSVIMVSAAIESEIAAIQDENEKNEYIQSLGLLESGLSRVLRKGYDLLDLITFFTAGPLETHAWTIKKNSKAPAAAGVIHTDFERGFICAETISYDDYVKYNGEAGVKSAGKMRLEGKEYVVADGDIFHFRFNV